MKTVGQMRRVVFVAVVALAGLRMMFAQAGPPRARVQAVTETLHGVEVTDPYWWMEAGGQELTDWMKSQDDYTRALLEQVPGPAQLLAELRAMNTDATTTHVERRTILEQACRSHGIVAVYLFGSRADDGSRVLAGGGAEGVGSDLDVGLLFSTADPDELRVR